MYRRSVTMTTAAIFAFGVAFAAQPTSEHADRDVQEVRDRDPWVPGANMVMAAHEPSTEPLAPPR